LRQKRRIIPCGNETVVRKAYEIANEDDVEGCVLTAEILNEAAKNAMAQVPKMARQNL